ncbi:BRO-N domain-containing protein [Sphingopyxis granuli]|uniref:BRO-N domain-containing protein n=1 Tax=Sphingopyxis granuli TaxID=267128 RepID=UPI00082C519E|nr:hypothetical protein [Sphingopyxis granuli]
MDTAHPIILEYTGNPIRAVVIDGRPWFVLNDVCRAFSLYMKNGQPQVDQPARRIAEEDQKFLRVHGKVGPRAVRLSSVRGLYEAVHPRTRRGLVPANAPTPAAANRFRRWIEGEAVPALERAAA